MRDRFEEADRDFFRRVELGYRELARQEPRRVVEIDATQSIEQVAREILVQVGRCTGMLILSDSGSPL